MNTYFSKWQSQVTASTLTAASLALRRDSVPYDEDEDDDHSGDDDDLDDPNDEYELDMFYQDEEYSRRLDEHRRHWRGEWTKVDMLRAELYQLATGDDSNYDVTKYASSPRSSWSSAYTTRDSSTTPGSDQSGWGQPGQGSWEQQGRGYRSGSSCSVSRNPAYCPDLASLSTASTVNVRSTCSHCRGTDHTGVRRPDSATDHTGVRRTESTDSWLRTQGSVGHSGARYSIKKAPVSAARERQFNSKFTDSEKNRCSISSHVVAVDALSTPTTPPSPAERESREDTQTPPNTSTGETVSHKTLSTSSRHDGGGDVTPTVTGVASTTDQICITLDLNGLRPGDTSISIVNGAIKVFCSSAASHKSSSDCDKNVNTFNRCIELPSNVNPNDVRAMLTELGQLQIKAPLRADYTRGQNHITRTVPLALPPSGQYYGHGFNANSRGQPTQLSLKNTSSNQSHHRQQQQNHQDRQTSPNNNTTPVPVVSPVTMEAVLDYRGRVSNRTNRQSKTFLRKLFSG